MVLTTRVALVCSDDAEMQHLLQACKISNKFEIVATYTKGQDALKNFESDHIKVIVTKLKLIDMSGYDLVNRIQKSKITPCIIVKFSDEENIEIDFPDVLDYGHVEVIELSHKNGVIPVPRVLTIRITVLSRIRIEKFTLHNEQIKNHENLKPHEYQQLSKSKVTRIREMTDASAIPEKQIALDKSRYNHDKVVVIGASTGGPRMLVYIISQFPADFPPVLTVQHMPPGFIGQFAERMNNNANMNIKKAADGDILKPGWVYIAPGGYHMELEKLNNKQSRIKITDGPKVNYVKPAVDVTLFSAARIYENNVISVILTGMGNDGREGSRVVKKLGGHVIALNEQDSIVYGMNKSVIDAGLADSILGMDAIPKELGRILRV